MYRVRSLSEYGFTLENGADNYKEIEPLYRQHYAEMQARLHDDGIDVADYKPRLDEYFKAFNAGHLLNFIVRLEGEAVGYCNMYLTHDMHNGEYIAQEDTIFITKPHRNGIGKKLVKHVLDELCFRNVVRVSITPVTDLRVAKIWQRMGFKPTAQLLTYTF